MNIEQLEEKKKRLVLEKEIANLERGERLRDVSSKAANWSWWWVGPLSLFGVFNFLMGLMNLNSNGIVGIVIGITCLTPLVLRFMANKD